MPADIPDRSTPGPHDFFTLELAEDVERALVRQTGSKPHRVTAYLHRVKLDVNRAIWEGAQGNAQAIRAWKDFHRFIEEAKRAVMRGHGAGLLIDLHGLSSTRPFNELGFLVTEQQLELPNEELNHAGLVYETSVKNLVSSWPDSLSGFLRGKESLGEFLSQGGFPTMPSFRFPRLDAARFFPKAGAHSRKLTYFSGGYITRRHGRSLGQRIDAIQVETLADIRFDPARREAFAERLAEGLLKLVRSGDQPENAGNIPTTEPSPSIWPTRVHSGDEVFLELEAPDSLAVEGPVSAKPTRRIGRRWAIQLNLQRPGGRTVLLRTETGTKSVRVEDPQLDPTLGLWLDGALTLENRAFSGWSADGVGTIGQGATPRGKGLIFHQRAQVILRGGGYAQSAGYSISFVFEADSLREKEGENRYLFSHGRLDKPSSINIYISKRERVRTALRGVYDGYAPSALDVPLESSGFHHYILVVRPSGAEVYVDGVLGAQAKRGFPIGEPTMDLHLGGRHDHARTRAWAGIMDEIKIWSRPLSAIEVRREAHLTGYRSD